MPRLNGREVYTRAELQADRGLSLTTLERLWRERTGNGHPPTVGTVVRALAWDAQVWDAWYDRHTTAGGLAAGETLQQLAERVQRSVRTLEGLWYRRALNGHPQPLPPARDDPTTPQRWDPDTYLSWFADLHGVDQVDDVEPSRAGVGRPRGSGTKRHPYDGDPRLALARGALSANPDESNAAVARNLASKHADTTERVWLRIVGTARQLSRNP